MDDGAVQRGQARIQEIPTVASPPSACSWCHCASLLLSCQYVPQGVRCISESLPATLTFSLKTSVKV